MNCRKCGKTLQECKGWLERVNEKGVAGIWECRPICSEDDMNRASPELQADVQAQKELRDAAHAKALGLTPYNATFDNWAQWRKTCE